MPHIACKNKERRIEEIQSWKRFVLAYREAWTIFRQGICTAIFPPGTYRIRKMFDANAGPPLCAAGV